MREKIMLFITCLCLGLNWLLLVRVNASEEELPATISLSDTTVNVGGSGTVYVRFEQMQNLSGLSFNIYYDSSVFTFHSHITETVLRNANVIVNFDEIGLIRVSIISLEPINHTGNILRLNFSSSPQVSEGKYLLNLAVIEAYDVLLKPLTLVKMNGYITTVKQSSVTPKIFFSSPVQHQHFIMGDIISYSISAINLFELSAGNFLIYYDSNLLEVKSVKLGLDFNKPNVLSSVNYFSSGGIDISFASLSPLSSKQVLTIDFEVIADVNEQTKIQFKPSNLYDSQLIALNHNELSNSFNLVRSNDDINHYPRIYVTDYQGDISSVFSVDVKIDENSNLAAGDFHITYDDSKLEVIDIAIGEDISENGGYIFYNLNYSQDTISFSYINENGLELEQLFMTLSFKAKQLSESTYLDLAISGSNLVNNQFEPIRIDFVDAVIYLGEYKTVQYLDFDQAVIFETSIPKNEIGEIPISPERIGTTFSHWSLIVFTDNLEIYQAVYKLDDSQFDISDYLAVYNGDYHEWIGDFDIDGLSVDYINNRYKDAGTYDVEVDLYLDQVFQFKLTRKMIISPKPVDVILLDQTIQYGEMYSNSYDCDGLEGNDYLELEFFTDFAIMVGSQTLKAINTNSNYLVNFTYANLIVLPAPLLITAIDQSSIYGEPFSTLTYSIEGEIYNQDNIQVYLEKEPGVNAGEYEIIVYAEHTNYQISLVPGTYTIEKAYFNLSEVTFNNQKYEYSGSIISIEIEGVLPLGVSVSYINNENYLLGEHKVNAIFDHNNPNYHPIPMMEAYLTITPTNFDFIEFNHNTIEYNGQYHTLEPNGIIESASYIYIGEFSFKDPGSYDISVVISAYGYHDLTLTATLTIIRASLIISANNLSTYYGEDLLDLTYSVQGTIYFDDEVQINLVKETGLASGVYNIFLTAEHPNYNIETSNGIYTIIGSDIDVSELVFEDVVYTYDGQEKTLIVTGGLPEGVIGIEYQNNKMTSAGEIIAIAKIMVSDAYNPVESMIARMTIKKAYIEGVSLIGGNYVYDSNNKIFQFTNGLTQYGDTFEIITDKPLVYIYPGQYEVSVIIRSDNYHDLHLSASMTIAKGKLSIDESDFDVTITENSINISHPQYPNNIFTSLDGSNFSKTSALFGLDDHTEYTLSFYIGGIPYYEDTQVMDIIFTTYLSYESFMNSVIKVPNDLSARQEIIDLMKLKLLLTVENQESAQSEISSLIQSYNSLVESINQEFDDTESSFNLSHYYWTSITLVGLAYFRKERRK